jgi:hypothetical protein
MKHKFTPKDFLIVFLVILLAGTIILAYLALKRPEGFTFQDPLDEPTAVKNVDKFRAQITIPTTKSYGVYYDSAIIRHYLDSIYPKIKASILPSDQHIGYEWKVGFYWMMSKDIDNITKHDYCVMPILVSTSDHKSVLDYFKDQDNHYRHSNIDSLIAQGNGGEGNAYDAGTLWP